jgi:hypothetical protein
MLVRGNKKKKKEATRAGAGEKLVGCWAAWAERSEGLFFFFFLFQTPFKTTLLFKFKSNSFKLFSKIL